MIVINNVSQESGNKTTASIHFINLFPFYTKIKTSIVQRNESKTSILLRVDIKNLPKKTCPIEPGLKWVFLNFSFFKVFKAFYINYINSKSITEHISL